MMGQPSTTRKQLKRKVPNFWMILLFAIILRWIVGFYDYSGKGKPPMYGDYEAQRHWMEVTFNYPIEKWYVNSTQNDLNYWGLDYPPLTAYHSMICGYFADKLDSSYIELNKSRGYESPQHKLFMRSTVLTSDLLTFIPAAVLFSNMCGSHLLAVIFLCYPGLILIDHGHFQYNCVSLGLTLFAFIAFSKDRNMLGSNLFCLAINFKQMALYYALPIFFFLLGKCVNAGWKRGITNFMSISITVIVTFIVLWSPFFGVFEQVIKRIFPIERGIFEDKVSNVWCVLNIFLKLKTHFDNNKLVLLSSCATLLSVFPSSFDLYRRPNINKLALALFNSSLGYFLFSYHVHEKTILFVSLPMMLLFSQEPLYCIWFLLISSLSMLPLLLVDNLLLPFISLNVMYIICLSFLPTCKIMINKGSFYALIVSAILAVILIVLITLVPPPHSYPHLYPLLISVFCALHFLYFFIYTNWLQLVKLKHE